MKNRNRIKQQGLKRRHRRVTKKVQGTAARPRLNVKRSLNHVVATIVDDEARQTLAQVSSTSKKLALPSEASSIKMGRSQAVGAEIARLAKEKGITAVAFDRGGRLYHGRVKAVAEAARKGG
ncbi:50S ribosomal protein L18, partial [bacterium]|nr:50S ribosomal protein L18 [bacterium]